MLDGAYIQVHNFFNAYARSAYTRYQLHERDILANPTSFEWSLLDRVGNVARMQAFTNYVPGTATVSDLTDRWLITGALIDDAVGSQITGGQISIPATADAGWKSAPASDDNLNGAVMVLDFENAGNQYSTPILLPSYLDTFIVNGKINFAAAALAALVADILDTGEDVDYVSRDIQQLTALRAGFLADRKQRGQRSRTRTLAP